MAETYFKNRDDKLFYDKMCEWRELLGGDDKHSIVNQISDIMWYDAAYWTCNEAFRLSEQSGKTPPSLMAELLHHSFAKAQIVAMRKLIEKSQKGDRSVVSLRRIFDGIKKDKDLFTRRRFIYWDGRVSNTEINRMIWNSRNLRFDFISWKNKANRSEDDVISDIVIKEVEESFSSLSDFGKFANKWIAHASDPTNRTDYIHTWMDIREHCKVIINIGKWIACFIDDAFVCNFPHHADPTFSPTKGFEGFVNEKDIARLERYWYGKAEWWGRLDREAGNLLG